MKKLISVLLALVLCVTALPMSSMAEELDTGDAGAYLATNNVVTEAGAEIYVPLWTIATGITTLAVDINYDTDVLELPYTEQAVSGETWKVADIEKFDIGAETEGAGANLGVNGQDPTVSPYRIDWAYINPVDYWGPLATVKFNVKENAPVGEYEVTFTVTEAADTNGDDAFVFTEEYDEEEGYIPVECTVFTAVITVTDDRDVLDSNEGYIEYWGDRAFHGNYDGEDEYFWLFNKGTKFLDDVYYDEDENECTDTYLVVNGVVALDANGLYNVGGELYYIVDGIVTENDTATLVYYNGAWRYVKDGKIDYSATTLIYFNDGWYYVKNGKVDFSATTLIYFNNAWYYVRNGKVDFSATTLIYFNNDWYYVRNGKVDFSATTLIYFNNAWYYVKNGKVDFSATTLIYFNDGWYYVKNGKVDFSATTLIYFNDGWYYVKKGKVDLGATTLVYFNDGWYYVKKGKVDLSATTLVYFNQNWYYVEKGKVNFAANLRFKFNNAYYNVVNGVVKF